jgi:hypothetical protein
MNKLNELTRSSIVAFEFLSAHIAIRGVRQSMAPSRLLLRFFLFAVLDCADPTTVAPIQLLEQPTGFCADLPTTTSLPAVPPQFLRQSMVFLSRSCREQYSWYLRLTLLKRYSGWTVHSQGTLLLAIPNLCAPARWMGLMLSAAVDSVPPPRAHFLLMQDVRCSYIFFWNGLFIMFCNHDFFLKRLQTCVDKFFHVFSWARSPSSAVRRGIIFFTVSLVRRGNQISSHCITVQSLPSCLLLDSWPIWGWKTDVQHEFSVTVFFELQWACVSSCDFQLTPILARSVIEHSSALHALSRSFHRFLYVFS